MVRNKIQIFYFLVFFINISTLNGFLHWRLVPLRPLNNLACGGVGGRNGSGLSRSLSVQVHQLVQVESGLLEHLHLADVDVVKWVDAHARLLNVHGHGVGDELVHDLLQVTGGDLAGDDVYHLLTNLANLM
jgi:hypothetical protein